MLDSIKTILFATDLSINCIPAFDFTLVIAMQFKAKICLLHVMEKIPDYVESRLEGLFGEDQWKEMMHSYENSARQKLIGKRSSSKLIQNALNHLCKEAGIDEASCGYRSSEIIVTDGDIADKILETSKTYNCDLIVMGNRKGFLSKSAIGLNTKSVMKRSEIPVLVVPYTHDLETS